MLVKEIFLGNYDIQKIMSRNEFEKIRANLCHYPFYDRVVALNDPLWHSRAMMRHFQKNCATIAVPIGVSSLDEATIRSKGRNRAITYIANKPERFGFRFYDVVGWNKTYTHSFWDNGAGNRLLIGSSCARMYGHQYRSLAKFLENLDGMDDICQGALWMLMMGHQTRMHPDPSGL